MATWDTSKAIQLNSLEDLNGESNLINFSNDEIPFFVTMVYEDDHLKESAKIEFTTKFWLKYKKYINYRKKVVGKYLFFFNNKYIKVLDSINDSLEYGTYKDDRYFIQITNHCESKFSI